MIRRITMLATAGMITPPALAQHANMTGMSAMPGMAMPATTARPATRPAPAHTRPAAPKPHGEKHDGHTGHAMPGMAMPDAPAGHVGEDEAGSDEPAASGGTDLPAGRMDPPPVPRDHYADRAFPSAEMADARRAMMHEQGGRPNHVVLFNLAEYQIRHGRDGYRWDGEAWLGGDVDRLTLKSEGEGIRGKAADSAELQALWSHAIGPYFDFQAGIRHDFRPSPARTYATIGFEGLAPYQFEVEGAVFLSTRGDLLGRLEGYYDQRITQRLILQPRIELNLAAQDVPEDRIGVGLTDAEIGLRLRYEVRREFAPYVGVSWERKAGHSARFARAAGEDVGGVSFVTGIRGWF